MLCLSTFGIGAAVGDVVPPPAEAPPAEQKPDEPADRETHDEPPADDSDAPPEQQEAKPADKETLKNESTEKESVDSAESAIDTNEKRAESNEEAAVAPKPVQPEDIPALKPRVVVTIPSIKSLVDAWDRSHTQPFAIRAALIVNEIVARSEVGPGRNTLWNSFGAIRNWSDTPVEVFTFAPDLDGKARIAIRVDWPVEQFHEQLMEIRNSQDAIEFFTGVTSKGDRDGGFVFRLDDIELARLSASKSGGSVLSTHPDLILPPSPDWNNGNKNEVADRPLITLIYDFTNTEKDSGSGFFGSFNFIQRLLYQARVNDSGQWEEGFQLSWPPLTGLGGAMALNKVKDTFFVPTESFGAMAVNSIAFSGMVDQFSGFHMFNGAQPGAISRRINSTLCLTAKEGVGLIPIPDIVVQSRVIDSESFHESLRAAIKKQHEFFRTQERQESWHEEEVRGRTVFWNDGRDRPSGGLFQMRPVIFINEEQDASGRSREFMVMALTSTRPVGFVNRWLDAPRPADRRYVPDSRKTEGQGWFNWKKVYETAAPYMNLFIAAAAPDSILPKADELEEHLTEGRLTVNIKWTGATVDHSGPVPVGLVAAPALFSLSLQPEQSGATDLARERFARKRLDLFYHHAKLFKQDIGRWPAELAELDGYIDFSGNPYLLKLQGSGPESDDSWFGFLVAGIEMSEDFVDDDSDEDDDEEWSIDNKLFVIEWGEEKWTLGIKEGTLAHLERLYIDQDGDIHRVEKVEPKKEEKNDEQESDQDFAGDVTASLIGTDAEFILLQK
jgi:hypothetical protein